MKVVLKKSMMGQIAEELRKVDAHKVDHIALTKEEAVEVFNGRTLYRAFNVRRLCLTDEEKAREVHNSTLCPAGPKKETV